MIIVDEAVRHFVALKGGMVVGSRSTPREGGYTHAVLHLGAAGWFATFHRDEQHALRAFEWFRTCPTKELVRTVETEERIQVGRVWQ